MEKWYPLVANRTAKLSVNSMHLIWNERRLDFNKNVNQIHPKEVLGPGRSGRKVAILCDTCNNEGVTDLCREVDCLVHEATLEDEQEKNCIEKGHSTPGSFISKSFPSSLCRYHQHTCTFLVVRHMSTNIVLSETFTNSLAVVFACTCW